jgi:hypothetical protein
MRLTLFLIFVFLLIILVFLFELFNVGVPDFPLSDLASKIVSDRRTGSSSSFLDRSVDGLDFSIFVVEFVLHGLLDSFDILA